MESESMSKRKKPFTSRPLVDGHFYRLSEGPNYFGYSISRQEDKIKTGEIPRPISLSDFGRAKGWFGRTILAWQAEREAAAKRDTVAA
jgi:predicted DNA-binding transcriptional regulator AlpA